MIDHNKVDYLQSLQPEDEHEALFAHIRSYAVEHNVPIMEEDGLQLVLDLMDAAKAEDVLEIGSAIGYSALRFALSGRMKRRVQTIERDEVRAQKARTNISAADAEEWVKIYEGDALQADHFAISPSSFDVLFIDAAKGAYQAFFDHYAPCVKPGGLIITDNVLFRGYAEAPEKAPKRWRSMAKKVHAYNRELAANTAYTTTFHAVGDGVAVSQKD
ncbi:putative O-methyltransferase YrrM [Salsuginibacillus halophilus]|uniref:Putative O-methyltransferase YrrM n=1 Tax=Salsuginibacillus halophilus TaxID=517424 RepID=A0A2P8HFV1_9BACI|nr:O-methyltransferase [Salsuginibacillus halophilus]PSL45080.1 putative O-methyltransferase YrrM [Salsuginibacillus halophilus]